MPPHASKKLLFVLLLVIVAIIYLGFFFRSNRGTNLLGNPDRANQVLDSAIKSGTIENCAQLRGVVVSGTDYEAVCRGNILEKQAWEKLDSGYCDTLGNAAAAEECKTNMAIAAVKRSRNLAACSNVSQGAQTLCQASYWSMKAAEGSDVKLCSNIPDENLALSCKRDFMYKRFLNAPRDVSCSEIPLLLAPECATFKRILQGKQGGDCFLLSDPGMKIRCTQLVGK